MTDKIQYKLEDSGTMFCAYIDGKRIGEITFVPTGADKLIIDRTAVDSEYQGRNIGAGLVNSVVEYARKNNLGIIPLCRFARVIFDRHPEYNDVRISRENEPK